MGKRDAHALTEDIMKYEMRSFFIDRSTNESNAFLKKEWNKCIDLLEEGIPVKLRREPFEDEEPFEDDEPPPVCQVALSGMASFNRLRANVQKKRELLVDVLKFMCPRFKELQPGETTTALGRLVELGETTAALGRLLNSKDGYSDIEDHRIWPNDVFFVINNGTEAILNHVLKMFIDDNLFGWEYIHPEKNVSKIIESLYPDKKFVHPGKEGDDIENDPDGLMFDTIWDTFEGLTKLIKRICILKPSTEEGKFSTWDIKEHRKLPNITEQDIEDIKDKYRWEDIELNADNVLRDMLNIYVSTTLEDGYFHPNMTGIDASKETFLQKHPKYIFNKGVMAEDDLHHAFYQIGCFLEDLDMKVKHGDDEE